MSIYCVLHVTDDEVTLTGGLMSLRPSGGHGYACTVLISVTENLLCIAQMTMPLHLQTDTGIGAEAALHLGCSQAVTEDSNATRACVLLPNVRFLQLLL